MVSQDRSLKLPLQFNVSLNMANRLCYSVFSSGGFIEQTVKLFSNTRTAVFFTKLTKLIVFSVLCDIED